MNSDEIIKLACEAGLHNWYSDPSREYHFGCVVKFAELVAAAERDACAKVCEGMHEEDRPGDYADAIRSRSND